MGQLDIGPRESQTDSSKDWTSQMTPAAPAPARTSSGDPALEFGSDHAEGFTNAGQSFLSSQAAQRRALPEPPAEYHPGPLAPVRHAYEDSTLYKISSVLASYGQAMPSQLKIKLAQQEYDLNEQKNKLAWDNYYKSNELVRSQLQQHSRAAQQDFLEIFPNIKGQISSQLDPVKRKALATHWANSAEGMYPGGGKLVKFYHDNIAHVLNMDSLLSDPDEAISGPARAHVARVGYDNFIVSKEAQELSLVQGRDRLNATAGRFSAEDRQKLADGKMDENEFRKKHKLALLNAQQPNINMAAAEHFLDTPQGQKMMFGMNVNLNDIGMVKEKKSKEQDYAGQLKDADLKNTQDILEFAQRNPGMLPEQTVTAAQHRKDQHLGLAAKDAAPGQFSENNTLGPFLLAATKGAYNDPNKMLESAVPGTSEYSKRLGWLQKALDERAAAPPMGGLEARMSAPADTSNYIYADKLLSTGHAIPVRENVTEGQLRQNKNFLKVTPEQKKELRDLNTTVESAGQIFSLADKAFKGNGFALAEAERVLMLEDGPVTALLKVPVKNAHPELADYIARREGTLGKFARSISGEVGVLTDQDTARVRNLFPTGSDNAQIRKSKQKSLNNLMALNRKFAHEVLAGSLSPDEVDILKKSEKYSSAVNGLLGSIEQQVKANAPKEAKSLAETSEKPNRGEALLERMNKGTP